MTPALIPWILVSVFVSLAGWSTGPPRDCLPQEACCGCLCNRFALSWTNNGIDETVTIEGCIAAGYRLFTPYWDLGI